MIETIYSKDSKKSLESYDKKTGLRIIKAIEDIPLGDIKRLEGNNVPILFRLRVGKYRIIYSYLDKDCIKVIKIDTRGDIYK
ncbi:type II toxin-antitoxin system RelE/ParE family toxin [Tissierella sp.]|uniref:type II toxin-antitoxin system RelE family toxin n=1 Tax=Tissierella sp. TaxID=41274 RepID=UPI002855E622|nr:type II toxin-antitoxin system RelE/ParE family toxin [Tissierella sp.]MDR7855646.1 type II toxin-antitoxin system RelE/ParE family toxin [Tissierella sp.]